MNSMRIIIESRDELRVVDLSEVLYLQASRNYTDFHYTDGRVKSELSNLSFFESKVREGMRREGIHDPFLRLGRSLLINTSHVELVSMKLQKIAFRTNPPIYLAASKNLLAALKQQMGEEGAA